jgi:hypothetical protein
MKKPSTTAGSERLQNDARRFARLLVAEIKLYNAQKIEAGKRSNDIYSQLETEIKNARQLYDLRANFTEIDYLDEEIIKELADGDPNKMGERYHQSKKQ